MERNAIHTGIFWIFSGIPVGLIEQHAPSPEGRITAQSMHYDPDEVWLMLRKHSHQWAELQSTVHSPAHGGWVGFDDRSGQWIYSTSLSCSQELAEQLRRFSGLTEVPVHWCGSLTLEGRVDSSHRFLESRQADLPKGPCNRSKQ